MLPEDRAKTEFIRERVAADVATAGPLDSEGELLRFRREDGEILATAFGGQSDFPADLQEGAEASCVLVMNEIQDCVTGLQHRPWPELVDPAGVFVGVLDLGLVSGIACWVLREVPFCAVGQLGGAVAAAGLRVV